MLTVFYHVFAPLARDPDDVFFFRVAQEFSGAPRNSGQGRPGGSNGAQLKLIEYQLP